MYNPSLSMFCLYIWYVRMIRTYVTIITSMYMYSTLLRIGNKTPRKNKESNPFPHHIFIIFMSYKSKQISNLLYPSLYSYKNYN